MTGKCRGGESPVTGRRSKVTGFTLVELLVAVLVTLVLGTIVVMAYSTSMQSYYRTERKLRALAAFRSTTDRLEREVNSIVFKASVYREPVNACRGGSSDRWYTALWDTRVRYIHGEAWVNTDSYSWRYGPAASRTVNPINVGAGDYWKVNPNGRGLYKINFRPRYLGYYSSLDGFTIDRTEWYFNPPEERRLWANGLDDDGDDPEGDLGMRILYDDQGCLMFRKKFDSEMVWAEWYNPRGVAAPGSLAYVDKEGYRDRVSPNDYRDSFHGPYSRDDFPPQADEMLGPLTVEDLKRNGDIPSDYSRQDLLDTGYIVDTGTVIGEGFVDLRFQYVYKLPDNDSYVRADWWPWDNDSDPTNSSGKDPDIPKRRINCRIGGSWTIAYGASPRATANPSDPRDFDITYFSLPLAISAKFTFQVGHHRETYEKLIYLHSSRWLKYLNP